MRNCEAGDRRKKQSDEKMQKFIKPVNACSFKKQCDIYIVTYLQK
jgi:hypothetical protein